jgi:hypothetical protein
MNVGVSGADQQQVFGGLIHDAMLTRTCCGHRTMSIDTASAR